MPLEPMPSPETSRFKSQPGLVRIARAARYSWQGLLAAWRHEAAFRQELALVLPALVAGWVWAPGGWQRVALVGSAVLVLVVELLNSAIEALADAISTDAHPLLGRAKDLGSAAVMLTLGLALATWLMVFWP